MLRTYLRTLVTLKFGLTLNRSQKCYLKCITLRYCPKLSETLKLPKLCVCWLICIEYDWSLMLQCQVETRRRVEDVVKLELRSKYNKTRQEESGHCGGMTDIKRVYTHNRRM